MCEILVKAVDATHSDPDKDKAGCYKTDDAVVVMPDGHSWGKEELNKTKFYILKVPELSVKDALGYLKSETKQVVEVDKTINVILRRRKYKIIRTDFPQQNKDDITNKGITTLTKVVFTSNTETKSSKLVVG